MDRIVTSIQGLSSKDADLGQLLNFLKGQASTLANSVDGIVMAVHALDAAQHSLGVLFLLETFSRLGGHAAGEMAFIDLVAGFLTACSPEQIRLAPQLFVKLGRKFREFVMAARCPRKGILPLQAAVRALQPNTETLTPLHADVFMLCLASKCYNAASQLLSEDIFHVDPKQTCSTPRDLFLYCRYGSMLCIGRKQWARAMELQVFALTAPTSAPNAIVLDCYKQYVLVSLITHGAVPPLPKATPHVVRSVVEAEARQYTELATAYATHSLSKLLRCAGQNAAVFAADGNAGLVGQVVNGLTARNIQRLTITYLTLSLADIAAQVGLPSADMAEYHIRRMVASGDIFASISDADDGMVRFSDDPQQFTSSGAATVLADALRQCCALSERVMAMQHQLALSKEYLKQAVIKDQAPRMRLDSTSAVDAIADPVITMADAYTDL